MSYGSSAHKCKIYTVQIGLVSEFNAAEVKTHYGRVDPADHTDVGPVQRVILNVLHFPVVAIDEGILMSVIELA